MDVATFRAAAAPAFDDVALFPDSAISYLLGIAALRLDEGRWGELLPEGTVLFVAHRATLARQAAASSGNAQASGAPVSSKSVGGVSIAYNWDIVNGGSKTAGGNYNLTGYGREFLALARMVGMGVVQL